MSAAYNLIALIRRNSMHDAWININPTLHKALDLAITAHLPFEEDEFRRIAIDFKGGHWMGEGAVERWYSRAILHGHPTAVVSVEKWANRTPFLLNGERVYVGKLITWEGKSYRCTSIEAEFIRAKRDEDKAPETLIEIPREGFEALRAEQKAAAKLKRAAEREANRPDPVDLPMLYEHFDRHCRESRHDRGGYVDPALLTWAKGFGSDYERAWRECSSGYYLSWWLRRIGYPSGGGTADELRKRHSWRSVQEQIWRFVRQARGLPLKGVA